LQDRLRLPASGALTPLAAPQDDEISLFAIATVLLRNRWRIVRWAIVGALIALAAVFTRPKLYTASMSFVPQGADAARSSLASLAGQFGIATPSGNYSQQPEFYINLLASRELLLPIARDTFAVGEKGGTRMTFFELFEIRGAPGPAREEAAVKALRGMIKTSQIRNAGIIRANVATKWPSVSFRISESLLDGLNAYNLRSRQGQAAAERRFVEGRLGIAKDSLRAAEDRLQDFLARNKSGINTSPHLNSALQRLERDVSSRTTIVTSLTQDYEDVRIREVRDTPTITVVESPSVSTIPAPRRRAMSTLLGLILGAGAGIVYVLVRAVAASRKSLNDPDAVEFFGALEQSKEQILRRLPLPRRAQS
jgi:uncharacterized protein involved in exopolysaccharide biosynthesis